MPQIRSFDKPFEIVDYTEELVSIPNQWGLIGQLGIFSSEGVSQHTITVESSAQTLSEFSLIKKRKAPFKGLFNPAIQIMAPKRKHQSLRYSSRYGLLLQYHAEQEQTEFDHSPDSSQSSVLPVLDKRC